MEDPEDASSDSSSTSSLSAERDIPSLRTTARESNTLSAHIALITALRATADLQSLRDAFRTAYTNFVLPEAVWLPYLSDETNLATTAQQRKQVLSLHNRALADFATPVLHAHRLKFAHVLKENDEICDTDYQRFEDYAKECGAGYNQGFRELIEQLPGVQRLFEDPPQEFAVFEKRLVETPPSRFGIADESRVAAYQFYARFAEDYSTFAISVYERAVSEAYLSAELWGQYDSFLARVKHKFRPGVLARACRVLPDRLEFWQRAVTIADVAGLIRVIEDVRPFVMKSHDLSSACRLTKDVWTRYFALGCPEEAREKVRECLQFNVAESVEWASACAHAAAVMKTYGDADGAGKLMEDIIRIRSEARWWLAYAGLMKREASRAVYQRGMRSVGSVAEVHVMQDAWEIFEVSQGSENIMDRIQTISDIALIRHTEQMKGKPAERERRRKDKPGKRRRAEKGKKVAAKERKGDARAGKEKSSTVQGNGVDKMDEVKEDDTTARDSEAMEDGTEGSLAVKADKKVSSEPMVDGVEPKTVFLNNLPFSVTESDLQEAFSFAGTIKQIRLPKRSDGAMKGIAYIEFEDDEAATKALTRHNKPIRGRAVWVRRSKPPSKGRKVGRTRGVATRKRGGQRGGRRRAVIVPPRANVESVEKVSEDGDVAMEVDETDDANDGGMRQEDFRRLFLSEQKS